jgi:prolyl oligopeptidase PreP (S9A serine peptidase family)
MVMALLDHWNLSTEDQAALLGIASSNRAALSNYRSGKPIGTSRDQYERVGHLLGIHKNLRLLFPQNRNLVYQWMSTRNKAFDNLTPVEVVKEWGFAGSQGGTLYFVTNKDAPRYQLLAVDGATGSGKPVVAEGAATLTGGAVIGKRLVVETLEDAKSVVRLYETDGKPVGVVPLPGIGVFFLFLVLWRGHRPRNHGRKCCCGCQLVV